MSRQTRNPPRWPWLLALAAFLGTSLLVLSVQPAWAIGIGFLQGLAVGTVVGATGLVASYDDAWPDFWHTIGMAAILGIFSLVIYWIKQEEPSAFFWVAWAASIVGYAMLFFVPVLTWIAADLLIWLGTFTGWFFSGLFRPGYD